MRIYWPTFFYLPRRSPPLRVVNTSMVAGSETKVLATTLLPKKRKVTLLLLAFTPSFICANIIIPLSYLHDALFLNGQPYHLTLVEVNT